MPFRGPYTPTFERVTSVVRGRVEEMQDDLWLLQTDPEHLISRAISLDKPHLHDMLELKYGGELTKEQFIAATGLWRPLLDYLEWRLLSEELQYAKGLVQQMKFAHPRDHFLARERAFVLSNLRAMVKDMQSFIRLLLHQRAMSLPALRHVLKISKLRSNVEQFRKMNLTKLETIKNTADEIQNDSLLCLFIAILTVAGDEYPFDFQLSSALSVLYQAKAQGSKIAAALSDPIIQDLLSDLAILEDVTVEVDLSYPLVPLVSFEDALASRRPYWKLQKAILETEVGLGIIYPVSLKRVAETITTLRKASDAGRPRDIKWLEQLRTQHQLLKSIWSDIDAAIRLHTKDATFPSSASNILLEAIQYYCDTAHLARIDSMFERLRREFASEDEARRMTKTTPSSGKTFKAKVLSHQAGKQKSKINLPGSIAIRATAPETVPSEEHAAIVLYALSNGDLEVVDSLFANHDKQTVPRTIRWKDFCRCMTELGFSVRACGGSKYKFEGVVNVQDGSEKRQEKHNIMFHSPHPNDEMDRVRARQYGYRCWHNFGWVRENFGEL